MRALAAGLGTRIDEDDPPAQFLHLDDLASAVVLAHEQRLDGVFNVAADGWIPGETVRARRPATAPAFAVVVGGAGCRHPLALPTGPDPTGLRPYARHPWLVASDRLRAVGWVPTTTNEQAYVEGTEAKWWTMLTPKRKQELSLAAMSLASLTALVTLVLTIRRARSRLKSS